MNQFEDESLIVTDQEALLGRIHSLEKSSAVDGPGLRVVVFMQGCLFRCKYCHNRDSWDTRGGTQFTVDQIVEQVLPFRPFLNATKGGVTCSGGEAVLQAPFVTQLFKKLKEHGLNTCLDTNGFVNQKQYREGIIDNLLEYTDLVLLDIKHIDRRKHEALIGVSNDKPRNFARYLADTGQPAWIRHVLVPNYTDEEQDLRALAQFIQPMKNVEKVEILPYHRMGKTKWEDMGLEYPLADLEPPSHEQVQQIVDMFRNDYGLDTYAP